MVVMKNNTNNEVIFFFLEKEKLLKARNSGQEVRFIQSRLEVGGLYFITRSWEMKFDSHSITQQRRMRRSY